MKKLFGRKDKSDVGSPNPQDDNPYARQTADDPYAKSPAMNSYQQPSRPSGLPSGPRAGGGALGLPRGPAPGAGYTNGPPPPYSGGGPQQNTGYRNEKLGASSGYGDNRFDSGPSPNNYQGGYAPPPQRSGGYGGLGGTGDDDRGALFGGYKPPTSPPQQQGGGSNWNSGPDGPAQDAGGAYGGYGDTRELTEEEREEMQVQDVKREIIQTQKDTIASGQRSLAYIGASTESAMNIAAALARQREHLNNAERNIDNAQVHNRVAKESTKRLDKLNGSMFRPTGLNKKKLEQIEQETREAEREEMRRRDEARTGEYRSKARMEGVMQDLQKPQQLGLGKSSRSRREQFKFEDDDGEQEQNEEEIDNQIDQLAAGVSMLNGAARAINTELSDQITQVSRITEKSEVANEQVRSNHRFLERAGRMK